MQPKTWKSHLAFIEGIVASIAVNVMAWLAVLSATTAWKFFGHVAGAVAHQLLAGRP